MTDSQRDLLLHLLRHGDRAEAVAALCEETGADEETAREVIAQLARDNQVPSQGRRWAIISGLVASVCLAAYALLGAA